jgi:hypothetical protein
MIISSDTTRTNKPLLAAKCKNTTYTLSQNKTQQNHVIQDNMISQVKGVGFQLLLLVE